MRRGIMSREVVLYSVAGAVGLGAAILYLLKKQRGRTCKVRNPYESQKMVNEYLGFHYCPAEEYVKYDRCPRDGLDFPLRCAQLCLEFKSKWVLSRALDVGCAVGRSTFELAREFSEVVGVDYSAAFIAKCQELKMTGQADYTIAVEGDLVEEKTAVVDPTIDRSRVQFTVADACNLPRLGEFGCVFAGNLICRLPEPLKFLESMANMVVPGGTLVMTSPYTWLQDYTTKSNWIGGYAKEGTEVRGFDMLKKVLEPHFELLEEKDFPFVIRETIRKHQWTVAHATVWRRKQLS